MCCSLLYIYSLLVSGFTVNKTSAILFVVLGAVMVVALLVELMIINIYRRKLHENQKKTRQLDSVQKQLQMGFVANMTHEVRTPMNAILGFTTILAEMNDLDQETRHQLIMEVEKNKEVLLKILNDILDYSQLSSNSLQFQEEKVSVNAVLADCLALALAKCRNSSVTLVIADKLPYCSLKIDKRRFSQVRWGTGVCRTIHFISLFQIRDVALISCNIAESLTVLPRLTVISEVRVLV